MVQKNVSIFSDAKARKSCVCIIFQAACLLTLLYLIGVMFIVPGFNEKTPILADNITLTTSRSDGCEETPSLRDNIALTTSRIDKCKETPSLRDNIALTTSRIDKCKNQCRPHGSEALPQGIVAKASNLEMRPLWGYPKKRKIPAVNLLALAAGIKQEILVNEMVHKFLECGFAVMLFHYDGIVDDWKKFGWSDEVIHVSAVNQTKWWFAKRFLHPDIVARYEYIFLWDEDLGVENFHPERYLSIVKEEGLQISQPALDANKSEVHHQITARGRRANVHRRTYKHGECDAKSTGPPCTGWIEVMAPVFSRAAWRCVWYMIQNDLIHAWGLDMLLGYCAQGDRTQNIGVVDAEYVIHYGFPTLGEPKDKKMSSLPHVLDKGIEVRRQSYNEYRIFQRRWNTAIANDTCWTNPYPQPPKPIVLTHVPRP